MKFVVLAAADSWYLRDLSRAAAGDFEIVPLAFSQVLAAISKQEGQVSDSQQRLQAADAVLVRTMPPGSLEQVVFRMDALAQLDQAGTLVINPPRAIEVAVDKYLTTARLANAGLRCPRTIVCQTADAAMQAFEQLGGDVVIKPLFGSEGRGLTRVSNENLALRAFTMLERMDAIIYLQQFIEHEGFDMRLFVLGESVLGMRRVNPHDWRTNVSRGATVESLPVDDSLAAMARAAARSAGAMIAGVDVLPGRDGNLYVLEVNAVPGWKALSRALDLDVARLVLDYVASLIRR